MSSRNRNRILLPSEPKKGPSLLWGFALLFVAPPVSTFFGIYLLLKRAKAEYSHRFLKSQFNNEPSVSIGIAYQGFFNR